MRLAASLTCALVSGAGCAPLLQVSPGSRGPMSATVVPPPAVICTASMLAEVPTRPDPPADAGFPAPQTARASAQVQTYLAWLHTWSMTTRTLIDRLNETRNFCLEHQPKQDTQK